MRKKLISLFTILIVTSSCLNAYGQEKQEGVVFQKGTFREVLAKLKSNKKDAPKYIFVDCYTPWCGPCKMVAKTVFPTKEAGDYLNKNFLNMKIDMTTPEGIEFNKKYKINGYPTFIIIDANGKEMNRFMGAEPGVKWFINKVESIRDFKTACWYLREKFDESGQQEDAMAYLDAVYKENFLDSRITEFLEKNINLFNTTDIFSFYNWRFFQVGISSYGNSKIIADKIIENKRYSTYKLGGETAGVGSDIVNDKLYAYFCNAVVDYLLGKKNISDGDAQKYVEYINVLSKEYDPYANVVCDLYTCRKNNDTEGEIKILTGREFPSIKNGAKAIMSIQKIIKSNSAITSDKWDIYFKNLKGYQMDVEAVKKYFEKL